MLQKHKKYLVIVCLVLFICSFFIANVPLTPRMTKVSSMFVILFALPTYLYLLKTFANSKKLLIILGVYALIIESLAIHTSIPYGNFYYNDLLGSKVFGLTPWTVAFAYPPIVLMSYFVSRKLARQTWKVILLSALIATGIDLVLDPASVSLGFWRWQSPGVYYGVPVINFIGWLITSSIASLLIHKFLGNYKLNADLMLSGFLILFFWTSTNLWLNNFFPFMIGVLGLTFSVKYLQNN